MPKDDKNLNNEEEQTQETVETENAEVVTPSIDDVQSEVLPEETVEDVAVDADEKEIIAEDDEPSVSSIDSDAPITVQPVQFTSFENQEQSLGEVNRNLDILMDIKLQLTVELGRTELPVRKVLELTRGSIVELQKVAGEPVELFANGKLVATGEVVVIEDNFGLRITSITDPEDRIKGL